MQFIFVYFAVLMVINHLTNGKQDEVSLAEFNEYNGREVFKNIALSQKMITDKVMTKKGYPKFEIMYGLFLMPLRQKLLTQKKRIKLLEIGLGCKMKSGPGASAQLWEYLFPNGNLWIAEYNKECVEATIANKKLDKFHVLIGDQGNKTNVKGWLSESGGNFDVIIDDGGHRNQQILTSLLTLWPGLAPGGVYFIEDLAVGTHQKQNSDFSYDSPELTPPAISVIQSWSQHLVMNQIFSKSPFHSHHGDLLRRYPAPSDVEWVFCQINGCAIGKKGKEWEK